MDRNTERWAFIATHVDTMLSLTKEFTVIYYPNTSELEMIDNKHHRIFLRRTKVDIPPSAIFIGACINVLSRQLNLVDYADEYTRKTLGSRQEQACLVLGSSWMGDMGTPLNAIADAGLNLVRTRTAVLDGALISQLAQCPGLDGLPAGECLAVDVLGPKAVSAVQSIAASLGSDAFAAATAESAQMAVQALFEGDLPNTATLKDASLCVIKPHAVLENNAGRIIQDIQRSGLAITAVKTSTLDGAGAAEFLEVYKGVVPEYSQLVKELEAGPCIALEVAGDNAHARLRALCGPHDSEIAKHLRPSTIRAKYGVDKVRNAVHCTDLPDDTELELEYFFQILP
ncbi:hypothetical protein PTSG_10014 [Salpingoeca rosetta]|uniref:DM10 domain-containing protein n=1 Tax=Salpingoeca rosetta (strain ATCC 50818 / BSB-021) TaxID=946362 RepID=F2UP93_SALR5|nr:uncharacterized protein PTSG_10014 [Salpingoeca rosetta]EGD79448.1 hypothetical protein PTSG_10014 [Salpingoeca rosetta]|eukprot:XP_004988929.1 hypothetical protein PTSG_10014 [Salpingoeca rosetta]